jgi:hypothetical protein
MPVVQFLGTDKLPTKYMSYTSCVLQVVMMMMMICGKIIKKDFGVIKSRNKWVGHI